MSVSVGYDSAMSAIRVTRPVRWPSTVTPEAEGEIRAAQAAVEAFGDPVRDRDKVVAKHDLAGVARASLARFAGVTRGTITRACTRGRRYLEADGESTTPTHDPDPAAAYAEVKAASKRIVAHRAAVRERDKVMARHHLAGVIPRDVSALADLPVSTFSHIYLRGREYLLADGEATWSNGEVILKDRKA